MAINGSGLRDNARVLGMHKNTVSRTIKKILYAVNPNILKLCISNKVKVVNRFELEGAELDEQRSFVRNKKNERWLWLAIDHKTSVYCPTF